MVLRVREADRQRCIMKAWDYMHSRYKSDLLHHDGMLLSEIKGIAALYASTEAAGYNLSFDILDHVRYAQDFLEFKGRGNLYKIFLLMYDREAWVYYKNSVKGSDRRKALKEEEFKFNKFLEKERKKKWQEQVIRKK